MAAQRCSETGSEATAGGEGGHVIVIVESIFLPLINFGGTWILNM
jgi:hypothetical protein